MEPSQAQSRAYPCPCCGHLIHEEGPGSYGICPICFWEDDLLQLRWPESRVGANALSLIEAQRNAAVLGAMEVDFIEHVRPATADEPVDAGWRPIDPGRDHFEAYGVRETQLRGDLTALYWWRPTFWRRGR